MNSAHTAQLAWMPQIYAGVEPPAAEVAFVDHGHHAEAYAVCMN